MDNEKITKLIIKIDDEAINKLSDIAKFSYSKFLERVGSKLHPRWSYYLYQHAIHSVDEAKIRSQTLRGNPKVRGIKSLYNS